MNRKRNRLTFIFLGLSLLVLALLHVHHGSFDFKPEAIWHSLFHFDLNHTDDVIYREIRIPRTLMALMAGAALAVSGLLMQTYFNNPLAGPGVLGITSGSSLLVALSTLSGLSFFMDEPGLILSALAGAFLFSLLILFFSFFVRSAVSLLLIGMMIGSFTSAIIQVLQMSTSANNLKAFILWGFGSLQQVHFDQFLVIIPVFLLGMLLLILLIKPLNLLVLGESQAQLLGVNLKLNRLFLIAVASLFAGLITAFCGPISFIGLAIPNLVKALFSTRQHGTLILGCLLLGALALVCCDLLVMYLEPFLLLPLNAVTALLGSPVVVWIILKRF